MKSFFKTLFASFCGALIALLICCLLVFSMISSMVSLADTAVATVPTSAILKINFNQQIGEQGMEEPFDLGSIDARLSKPSQMGIYTAVRAIEYAATDPAIKFIYINPEALSSSLTHVEEVRNALERFRNSGKAIISYCENYSQAGYYLSSVSDKIYVNPEGAVDIHGVSSQIMFFKGILDKLGVDVQLIRHGKYKSAGEQFIASDISAANREQNQAYINSLWNAISSSICASRNIEVKEFNRLIDDLELVSPKDLLKANLVDGLFSREDIVNELCNLFGVEKEEDIKMITLDKYAAARIKPDLKAKDKIAIIYADGEIVSGKGDEISADKFASVLSTVRKDSSIKAVVFRVNSPGGSAQAAEIIRKELIRLKEVKPVIASYGSYAASGGYWISANADKIFTNSTTLTGSIGVFSMIPSFGKVLKNKLSINPVSISSNKHSDMMSMMRPLDKSEVEYIQKEIEIIYDSFLSIVASGRGMTPEKVDEIAQGRVWAGDDALGINLADEKGDIFAAVNYAAASSNLSQYRLVEYPIVKNPIEKMMESFKKADASIEAVSNPEKAIEDLYYSFMKENGVYARLLYDVKVR